MYSYLYFTQRKCLSPCLITNKIYLRTCLHGNPRIKQAADFGLLFPSLPAFFASILLFSVPHFFSLFSLPFPLLFLFVLLLSSFSTFPFFLLKLLWRRRFFACSSLSMNGFRILDPKSEMAVYVSTLLFGRQPWKSNWGFSRLCTSTFGQSVLKNSIAAFLHSDVCLHLVLRSLFRRELRFEIKK